MVKMESAFKFSSSIVNRKYIFIRFRAENDLSAEQFEAGVPTYEHSQCNVADGENCLQHIIS